MNPIVGIGELLWDVFPDGRKVAGGAPFNFAFHCTQLGHPAVIVSRVGDDELGRELRQEVRRLGLTDEFIQTDHDHPTGTVKVTVDANGQPSYQIAEDVAWDYIGWEPRLTLLREFTPSVVFGTLAQRSPISADTVHEFVMHVGSGFRVMDVNLRPTNWQSSGLRTHFERVQWIKMSVDEMTTTVRGYGLPLPQGSPEISVLEPWLLWKTVVLTHGERGCEVFEEFPHGMHFTEPGVPARVVDTVGAGDAFTAAMVCLHLEGRPLRECARFANHYAARVCEHRGATPRIDRVEVERAAFG